MSSSAPTSASTSSSTSSSSSSSSSSISTPTVSSSILKPRGTSRRDSFNALSQAVQATQQHQASLQQQAHHQQYHMLNQTQGGGMHAYSPSVSPAPSPTVIPLSPMHGSGMTAHTRLALIQQQQQQQQHGGGATTPHHLSSSFTSPSASSSSHPPSAYQTPMTHNLHTHAQSSPFTLSHDQQQQQQYQHQHHHSHPPHLTNPYQQQPYPQQQQTSSIPFPHHQHQHPQADFPFPSLLTLNRSRLLHLLEYQCKLSSEVSDETGTKNDEKSYLHYCTLIKSIRALNLNGGIGNFSFVHSSAIDNSLLGSSSGGGKSGSNSGSINASYTSRLTSQHLLDILLAIRKAPSPNLAHPSELPAVVLDSNVFYPHDVDAPERMQLSPFVYHRTLAFLALLMNLHIHQLTLSRILNLLHGIDTHLNYWLSHQRLSSLPIPYRIWKWMQYTYYHGATPASSAPMKRSSSTPSFITPIQSPRRSKYDLNSPPPLSSVPLPASANPYHNWTKLAARNVRELVELKNEWTTRCGRIAIRMHQIQTWINAAFSKTATPKSSSSASTAPNAVLFHHQLELNEQYFNKIYHYITREDIQVYQQQREKDDAADDVQQQLPNFTPARTKLRNGGAPSPIASSSSPLTIQAKIRSLYSLFGKFEHYLLVFTHEFPHWFEGEIHARRKPHHIFEWWHWYAGFAAVGSFVAIYALRNQSTVQTALQNGVKSSRFFLNEHLWEPIANIYETTFQTFHDRSLFSTNSHTLEQSKANLSTMLNEFAHHHVSELSEFEQKNPKEYRALIAARAKANDMDLVMKPYNREIQHPIRSLLLGDLMRGLLIQVQKVKVDTEAAMLAMDQILKSNAVNFNILATIPFLLLVYGAFDFTNKWILRGTWASKKVRGRVRQSKKLLAELEQIFILHLPTMQSASGVPTSAVRACKSSLHSSYHTLSVGEFASLGGQEQEDEDDALRLRTSASSKDLNARASGTEIFGNLDEVKSNGEDLPSDEEEIEDDPAVVTNQQINSIALFPVSSPHRAASVLGMSNHAYGHTLLLIHELSLRLSSLPLSSSFSSSLVTTASSSSSSSSSAADPRFILHKDLILLASNQLTPDQKYRWIEHMWRAYSFLATP